MRITSIISFLFHILFPLFFYFFPICSDELSASSHTQTIDPRIVALRPEIRKLNILVVAEIEKGLEALTHKDIATALNSFIAATAIAPYEPMSYILLMRTFIASGQENLAYKWLMLSGRNISDSDQIINGLYQSLKEFNPPLPEQISESKISIAPFKDNKSCAISFTFDDGEPSVTQILALFEQYGFHATVAINPGVTSEGNENKYRGSWDDWRTANAHGHEIANHGTNHIALPGLSPQQLQTEVMDSFQTISEKIGKPPATFIFPEDKSTPEIVRLVETKHVAARDHDSLSNLYRNICIPIYGGNRFSSKSARQLIDMAIDRHLWLIPQCHGLYSPTIEKSFKAISKDLLIDQLNYLTQNKDKIWVGRFIDVYKYLKERKETQIIISNTQANLVEFSLSNHLEPNVYDQPLTVIIPLPSISAAQKAVVINPISKRRIPHYLNQNTIVINIIPQGDTVRVKW